MRLELSRSSELSFRTNVGGWALESLSQHIDFAIRGIAGYLGPNPFWQRNSGIDVLNLDLSDDDWVNPRSDWDGNISRLAAMFEDEPLGDALERWARSCTALRGAINDDELGRGVGRAHLSWLLDCCDEGLALRNQSRRWVDRAGWPEQEDPRTEGLNAEPPIDARTAWSRLTRLHQLLRNEAEPSQIQDLALSLFEQE